MSIITPRARSATMRWVRSSCSAIASRSCMSTWIETSRQSPILRIGISLIGLAPGPVQALARSTMALSVRRSASPSASAMVALETTFSSRPRWTIVWAICGRMPLRMQSAPISRAAEIVLIRCCATRVSTVGTPVMSMMAISAPEATMRSSRFSITICVRALSSVPISGSARMPSQSCTTGVDSSSSSCCCRPMTSSRVRE